MKSIGLISQEIVSAARNQRKDATMTVAELIDAMNALADRLRKAGAVCPVVTADIRSSGALGGSNIYVMAKKDDQFAMLFSECGDGSLTDKLAAATAFVDTYEQAADRLADILGIDP